MMLICIGLLLFSGLFAVVLVIFFLAHTLSLFLLLLVDLWLVMLIYYYLNDKIDIKDILKQYKCGGYGWKYEENR